MVEGGGAKVDGYLLLYSSVALIAKCTVGMYQKIYMERTWAPFLEKPKLLFFASLFVFLTNILTTHQLQSNNYNSDVQKKCTSNTTSLKHYNIFWISHVIPFLSVSGFFSYSSCSLTYWFRYWACRPPTKSKWKYVVSYNILPLSFLFDVYWVTWCSCLLIFFQQYWYASIGPLGGGIEYPAGYYFFEGFLIFCFSSWFCWLFLFTLPSKLDVVSELYNESSSYDDDGGGINVGFSSLSDDRLLMLISVVYHK